MPISIGGVPRKQLVAFTRQLVHTCKMPACPYCDRCRFSKNKQKPGLMKAIIGGVADEVEGRRHIIRCDAASIPKAFDKLYVNMINAGEARRRAGHYPEPRLADFMEKAAKLKKKVIGAMIYPAVVISIAVGIVSLIMIFVIPKFQQIFKDFRVELPGVTQVLLNISNWFAPPTNGWAYVLFSPIVFMLLIRLIRMSEGGKYAVDAGEIEDPHSRKHSGQDCNRPIYPHARHADQRRRAHSGCNQHHQGNVWQRGV